MRPAVKFLNQVLIEKIIAEARTILIRLGVEVQNKQVVDLLNDHGAKIDKSRVISLMI